MNAPVTRVPKLRKKVGDVIQVPIKTDGGLKNISAISLSLMYDKNLLGYVKTALSDELSIRGSAFTNAFQMPGEGNEDTFLWRLAWSQIQPISQLAHESICIIEFTCLKEGTTVLEWQWENGNCEYADSTATPLIQTESNYIDGYVKIS